jgi:hypothetical protein
VFYLSAALWWVRVKTIAGRLAGIKDGREIRRKMKPRILITVNLVVFQSASIICGW